MPDHGRWGERLLDSPLALAALPAWALWRPLVALREASFDLGLRRVSTLPAPVISVGNLALGGTGKTPLVALLCELLAARGRRPAVLMRGYRAGSDGRNDEAAMLAWPVHCHPRRAAAGAAALAAGADALVLDDGLQHRALHRDLDLVALDATRPWGRIDGRLGRTLPLGRLREGPRALRRATAVLLTRIEQAPTGRLEGLRAGLQRRGLTVIATSQQPLQLRRLDEDADRRPCGHLAGAAVRLVSGIGHPDSFRHSAETLGWRVLGHDRFPDHHHFTAAEARALADRAALQGAALVMTAKDAVKLRALLPEPPAAGAWILDITARPRPEDVELLHALLDRALAVQESPQLERHSSTMARERQDAVAMSSPMANN